MGPSWARLGASWGPLGGILGHHGAILGHLRANWGPPGASLGHLGPILGPAGGLLGASWVILGLSWAILDPVGGLPGLLGVSPGILRPPSRGCPGPPVASWCFLAHSGVSLRMGTPRAAKSDMGTPRVAKSETILRKCFLRMSTHKEPEEKRPAVLTTNGIKALPCHAPSTASAFHATTLSVPLPGRFGSVFTPKAAKT